MTKQEYIKSIVDMLQQCNSESVLYFIKRYLEKHLHIMQVEGR